MAKVIDLKNDSIKNSFFRYLLPAISGMMIKSIFIIVDSIFVGRGVGPLGLGAIALTFPFFSLFTAIAMMVGTGGATMMSVQFGKENYKAGQSLFIQSMTFIFLLVAALVSISLYWREDIFRLMGATGEMAQLANDYLSVVLLFFLIHSPAWVLACFVRNDTNPSLVMYAMAAGGVANIVLDYLFIFEFGWGIKGGALATGLSLVLIFGTLLFHFVNNRGVLKLNLSGLGFNQIRSILNIGLPIFFIETTAAVTVLIFNYVLLANYSELHVTAYGIVMNMGLAVLFLMLGIGQACQPIISFNFGADNMDRVKATLFLGLRYSLLVGISATVLVMLGAERIAALFTEHNQPLIDLTATAIQIYFLAPIPMGLNIMTATLFQAIELPSKASVLSLSRGFVFVVVGLAILPLIFTENGIWGSVLFAEVVTAVMSLAMLIQFLNQGAVR